MRFVSYYGDVYRLSDRNYRKLLRLIKDEQEFNLNAMGKRVAENIMSVTDMTAEQAADELTAERADTLRAKRQWEHEPPVVTVNITLKDAIDILKTLTSVFMLTLKVR